MSKKNLIIASTLCILVLYLAGCSSISPMKTAEAYLDYWQSGKYNEMYSLLSSHSQASIDRDTFVTRYQNIFSAIELESMEIFPGELIRDKAESYLTVKIVFNSRILGAFEQDYTVPLVQEDNSWKTKWSPSLIFPVLQDGERVILDTLPARRGSITDRFGSELAVDGPAYTVGAVPGAIPDERKFAQSLAPLIELSQDFILDQLQQPWVTDDTFVPLRSFPLNLSRTFKDQILAIKGVKLVTNIVTNSRRYLDNELYAHVIGYVQRVNDEDLKEKSGKGYKAGDTIGRQGIEAAMEDRLFGKDGFSLHTRDEAQQKRNTIVEIPPRDGNTVVLTLDPYLQSLAFQALEGYKGAIVAMEPHTGEILAMVSYPNFDPNIFPNGVLPSVWKELSNNPHSPFINRCTYALYPPGSTFKPFTAVIALEEGVIDMNTVVDKARNREWIPNNKWNAPPIRRTPHPAGDVNLDRALVWSNNIFFAWTALKMDGDTFDKYGALFGMNEPIPFPLNISKPQVKGSKTPWSAHLLAGTSYGQGEMLVSPLQMAAMYTAFANKGSIILPQLIKEIRSPEGEILEAFEPKIWKEGVIPSQWVDAILPSLIQVVEDKTGTGHASAVEGLKIAAKTGTAQADDKNEKEISWYIGITLEGGRPLLLCIVLEVPPNGGSAKLHMAREIFERYCKG